MRLAAVSLTVAMSITASSLICPAAVQSAATATIRRQAAPRPDRVSPRPQRPPAPAPWPLEGQRAQAVRSGWLSRRVEELSSRTWTSQSRHSETVHPNCSTSNWYVWLLTSAKNTSIDEQIDQGLLGEVAPLAVLLDQIAYRRFGRGRVPHDLFDGGGPSGNLGGMLDNDGEAAPGIRLGGRGLDPVAIQHGYWSTTTSRGTRPVHIAIPTPSCSRCPISAAAFPPGPMRGRSR